MCHTCKIDLSPSCPTYIFYVYIGIFTHTYVFIDTHTTLANGSNQCSFQYNETSDAFKNAIVWSTWGWRKLLATQIPLHYQPLLAASSYILSLQNCVFPESGSRFVTCTVKYYSTSSRTETTQFSVCVVYKLVSTSSHLPLL